MSINSILVSLLNSDMDKMFKEIVNDYNDKVPEMTVDSLNKMFKISDVKRIGESKLTDSFEKPQEKVNDNCRCMARIWGSTPPVAYYCHKKGKYIYGQRCTRPRKGDGDYCGLHKKNLPHGRFGELPPHEHFEKYLVTSDS